ncbi:hypothetical protein CCC_01784 [Paramagnetospirillum magnetotacticum MS-1]|uniref:Uncharacterized protein n=1 Tax=Paramagnetospirillum magnetotacticum MS-1 TaxID=272627 RepID=A0A0C2UW00_PARME|nr:hypothetical protein CCC_01784 [Paramagnetospirillum magnetotacticum MS-1]
MGDRGPRGVYEGQERFATRHLLLAEISLALLSSPPCPVPSMPQRHFNP